MHLHEQKIRSGGNKESEEEQGEEGGKELLDQADSCCSAGLATERVSEQLKQENQDNEDARIKCFGVIRVKRLVPGK